MNFLKRIWDYIQWHRTHWVRVKPPADVTLLKLFAKLRPQTAIGRSKVRIGNARDGAYVMLNDFQGVNNAVSLGIGPNVSWDLAVAQKGISVLQFDHTVDGPPEQHPQFIFAKKRIGTDVSQECVKLDTVLASVCKEPFLLKMDIECDEWDVLDQLDWRLLDTCPQIVVEMHDFARVTEPDWCERALRVLNRFEENFAVVHVHGNNLSKHLLVDRLCLPDCLEVTFANRRFFPCAESTETFPGRLDKMNNPAFPDFKLGRFCFDSVKKPQ